MMELALKGFENLKVGQINKIEFKFNKLPGNELNYQPKENNFAEKLVEGLE